MGATKKIALLFPGQGAQYVGMGKEFFDAYAIARETFEEADEILSRKLSEVVFHGSEQELTETRNSQLGIYVVSIAILRVLQQKYPMLVPQYTAGLSLGEYTALTSAGALSFAQGVSLVDTRAKAMNDACEATPGGMAVILGLDADAVDTFVKALNMPQDLWVANYNCPGQIVISGTLRGIEAGVAAAKQAGAKRALPLAVHGAFHSGLMARAAAVLAPHIDATTFVEPKCDVYMNVTGSKVDEVAQIRQLLAKQVTSPVRWEQSMRSMAEHQPTLYIEVGCGKALTGFHKRIGVMALCVGIEKVDELPALEQALQKEGV